MSFHTVTWEGDSYLLPQQCGRYVREKQSVTLSKDVTSLTSTFNSCSRSSALSGKIPMPSPSSRASRKSTSGGTSSTAKQRRGGFPQTVLMSRVTPKAYQKLWF
jgi:hypothetical protein